MIQANNVEEVEKTRVLVTKEDLSAIIATRKDISKENVFRGSKTKRKRKWLESLYLIKPTSRG